MNSLRTFLRVVFALAQREAVTRNGKFKFGYVWAFAEPAIYIVGFVMLRQFINDRTPFGDNGILFFLTGLLTFRTAMGLTRRTLGAIHSNIALLTFPQVKTFDVIIARIVLECSTWLGTAAIFVMGLYWATGIWIPANAEVLIAGYSVTLFFGASFGFFNATFVRIFPFWENLLSLVSLPLLFISAVFYVPGTLPLEALNYLWWNPYLHLVEWVRSGVYIDYHPFLSQSYVLSLSTSLLFAGLFFNRFFHSRMLN